MCTEARLRSVGEFLVCHKFVCDVIEELLLLGVRFVEGLVQVGLGWRGFLYLIMQTERHRDQAQAQVVPLSVLLLDRVVGFLDRRSVKTICLREQFSESLRQTLFGYVCSGVFKVASQLAYLCCQLWFSL